MDSIVRTIIKKSNAHQLKNIITIVQLAWMKILLDKRLG